MILAAIAPLPEDVPELDAGFGSGGRENRNRRKSAEKSSPADCRSRIRHLRTSRAASSANPKVLSATITAIIRLQHDYPVFEAQAVFHRKDAIFPATVVGKPRQEDFFIGDYLQELLSPLFPLVMPAVQRFVELRRNGFSLAGGGGRQRTLRARSARRGFPHFGRRSAFADEISAFDRQAAGFARFQNAFRIHSRTRRLGERFFYFSTALRSTRSITLREKSITAQKRCSSASARRKGN